MYAQRQKNKVKADQERRQTTTTAMTVVPPPVRGDRHDLVAEAAWLIAERRGFAPGGELDDWLAAERQIAQLFAHER